MNIIRKHGGKTSYHWKPKILQPILRGDMSTDQKLPDSFDVIVCGTGLPESMVAACLSRIGKKVLHIDRNDYYGGQWATFTFESLNKWIQKYEKQEQSQNEEPSNGDVVPSSDVCIRNVVIRSYIPDKNTNAKDITILNGHINENDVNENENDKNSCNNEITDNISEKNCNDINKDINDVEDKHDVEDGTDKSDVIKKDVDENCSITDVTNNTNATSAVGENFSITDVTNNTNATSADQTVSNKSKVPLTMISQARIRQNFDDISLEDFLLLSRKFNLDITTKFLFSAGPLVNAIIKANISHYAEFKVVNRILTWKDDQIMEVPCNRSDVFGSMFLTMIEKRVLMKFLTSCLESPPEESEEINSFNGRPFKEFLESRRLSENLQKFIIYSIALVKPDTPTELALIETTKFLKSLGRYGKSPFIWPLYGTGELPQAFCRMSAVFGGTYCLNLNIETIEFDENKKVKTCIDGQKIECDHIVMDNSYVPYRFNAQMSGKMISKGILITNQSLLPAAEEHLSFLTIPPLLGHEESVRVIEIGPASSACPSGLFVLYLTCASSYSTAEEDLLQYTTLLTAHNEEGSNKPKLLWSLYFNQLEDIIFEDVPDNVFIPSMPDSSLGFELAVEEAKNIFHSICPEEEFMLAVPNSEDIIWGTDSEEKTEKLDNKDIDNSNNTESLNLEKTSTENVSFQAKVDDNLSDQDNPEKTITSENGVDDNSNNKDEKTIDKDLSFENGIDGNLNEKDGETIDKDIIFESRIGDKVNDNLNLENTVKDISLENGIDDNSHDKDEKANDKDISFENRVIDTLNDRNNINLEKTNHRDTSFDANLNDKDSITLEKTVDKDINFLDKVDSNVMKVDEIEIIKSQI